MSTRSTPIFKDPNVAKHLSLLHDKYVIVSADKAPNNIVFVCKSHYIDCLIKELGIDNSLGNPNIYHDNHRSVLCSFGISTKDEELDLPSLYWIPKLHKCPFKQPYIAGSAKCSTKPLSKLLTCIRDRPFNLKGGLWFFVSFRIFFSDDTRVRIFIFFVAQSAIFFSIIQH